VTKFIVHLVNLKMEIFINTMLNIRLDMMKFLLPVNFLQLLDQGIS